MVTGGTTPSTEVLAEAARALHGEQNLDRLLAWALAAARRLTGAETAAFGAPQEGVIHWTTDPDRAPVGADADDAARRVLNGTAATERDGIRALSVTGSGGLHGVLLVSGEIMPPPPDAGVAVRSLAAHLGVALDNHATAMALVASQRETVHQLQDAVLPPEPSVPFTELGRHYSGAGDQYLSGGDLYDWVLLPDGDLHFAVVDIMGKGVAATKDALAVTHALRLLVLDGCPLEHVVRRADEIVTAQNPELVATLMVGRYQPTTGRLRLAGGGHPPALLVQGDDVREIAAPGIPIGWPSAGSQMVVEEILGRSDTLIVYTDGLIEATRNILEGLATLARAALETRRYPARQLARALIDRALHGATRQDDALALVLRRRVPPPPAGTHTLPPFEYCFSPYSATVPLARNLLRDWLSRVPVDAPETDDLVLVASELCANAVRHASGSPGGVALRARAEGDDIVIEVDDDGRGLDALTPFDEVPDPRQEAGRGLFLVQALTDEVTVERRAPGTRVTARKRAVISGYEHSAEAAVPAGAGNGSEP